MSRHIACLTFDFDATSIWISRGMTTANPMSRGEFGLVGAKRILALLRRHGIPSTWFIPGHTLESHPDACREVIEAGHEIGHHGWTHMSPTSMSLEDEEAELERATQTIVRMCGNRPRGYRSPAWDLSKNTIDLLLKHDFYYGSNLMANDFTPYRARKADTITLQEPLRLGERTKLIEIPPSWSLDDAPHFEMVRTPNWVQPGLMNASNVLENWIGDFQYMTKSTEWGALTYTFHPYCSGRGHRMLMLESLIEKLTALGAVFMKMEDLASEYDQREPFALA